MQVPHKGGNYPMCRPLNNVYESDTNHGKVVDQREALPELLKNTNTQRKATKRDKSIQYEVKKHGLQLSLPEYSSNVGYHQKSIPVSVKVTKSCEKKGKLYEPETINISKIAKLISYKDLYSILLNKSLLHI